MIEIQNNFAAYRYQTVMNLPLTQNRVFNNSMTKNL